jgi:iron complex outermembrane receptor protein
MKYSTAALPLAALLTTALAGPALAQDDAVASATDAFGERVGIEQLGLYDEGQVRGFSLEASGAYRINDAYFARAAALNDPVLAGVSVRVGAPAASLAYPQPSGVVVSRLREPSATNQLTIGGGYRDFGTPVIQADGSWTSGDGRYSITGGAVYRPEVWWGGNTNGRALDIGAVARWKPTESQTFTAFLTSYARQYNGDYGMMATGNALPPTIDPFDDNYTPYGARTEAYNTNLGLLWDAEIAGWSLDAALFRSTFDVERDDFTLIKSDADGNATATLFLRPGRTNTADSGELRVSRVLNGGDFRHLLGGSVRFRKSEVDLASSNAVDLGPFSLVDGPPSAGPYVWNGQRGLDSVDQTTGTLNYGLLWKDVAQLRLGVHRTRYEKTVDTLGGARTEGTEERTFYNASLVWNLRPGTSVFASWVTGLEETGIAPQAATNRNEVLPPVEAEQYELGLRQSLGPNLTLITALFDVHKQTAGMRADGSYGLVGEETHRGLEVSLAGRIGEKNRLVFGAVAFTPEVSGPLVDAGLIGDRPAGLSAVVVNASLERDLGDGWSADGQLSYWGERWVNNSNSFKAPAVTTLDLGMRRRFEVAGRPAQFRVLMSNVTDEGGWWASSSTTLWPVARRTLRATFSMTFN